MTNRITPDQRARTRELIENLRPRNPALAEEMQRALDDQLSEEFWSESVDLGSAAGDGEEPFDAWLARMLGRSLPSSATTTPCVKSGGDAVLDEIKRLGSESDPTAYWNKL